MLRLGASESDFRIMKNFKSELFGSIPEPETFDELFATVTEAEPKLGRVRMWRGQADISWPIHSTAYRRLASSRARISESDVISYEENLLKHATHRGYRYLDGRELSDLELLARLQHHGAATRLVDATRSAFIALW